MDFSVYIIQDRTITNETLFENVAGDVGFAEHATTGAIDAVSNLAGVDVYDRYADPDKIGKTGIALTGDMVQSVQIKNERTGREVFSSGVFNRSIYNTLEASVFTTITVKGTLFAPEVSQLGSTAVRMKNMAKVMAWASLAPTYGSEATDGYCGDVSSDDAAQGESLILSAGIQKKMNKDPNKYADFYTRRVMVTVYSVDDMQFRAVLHDKVFVQSYEETYTDKDGNGTFTLVMKSKAASIFDVFVEGPTFEMSLLSVGDQLSTSANTLANEADVALQAAGEAFGLEDNERYKKIEKGLHAAEDITKFYNDAKDSDFWTPENAKDIVDHVKEEYVDDSVQSGVDDAKEYYELYEQLTDEQKAFLEQIPGFDDLPLDDKIEYLEKFLGK